MNLTELMNPANIPAPKPKKGPYKPKDEDSVQPAPDAKVLFLKQPNGRWRATCVSADIRLYVFADSKKAAFRALRTRVSQALADLDYGEWVEE